MRKFFRSLQAKYMLIILLAIFLVQISFMIMGIFVIGISGDFYGEDSSEDLTNPNQIEENWHEEAEHLQNISTEQIKEHFSKWKRQFPEASMFWVDENGLLREQLENHEDLPSQWTSAYTAKFIKDRYGGDPFTVIAFLGKDETNGFIVLEVPRERFEAPMQRVYDQYGVILTIGLLAIVLLFVIVSFLFFRSIRKRLMYLQESMITRDEDGLPVQTDVKKQDEVGQLEQTFNEMVEQLRDSRQREHEEEQLRRELIANLSHDLRTPLTKISAQTYSLAKKDLTDEAKQAIRTLDISIRDVDRLIENLMSYTLLMASKYKLEQKEIDVVRHVRECLASWYPAFEKEGFTVEAELSPFEKNRWNVDSIWLSRILDNLFQNVLRHAKRGQFIKVKTESTKTYDAFVIIDHGKGMNHISHEKGAGIGLSIVDMMVKGMGLEWDIETSEHGTAIKIMKRK